MKDFKIPSSTSTVFLDTVPSPSALQVPIAPSSNGLSIMDRFSLVICEPILSWSIDLPLKTFSELNPWINVESNPDAAK